MAAHKEERGRSLSRSPSRSYTGSSRSRSRSRSPSPICTVVVQRLTRNVTVVHLDEIFAPYGKINEVELPIIQRLGTHKGTAYITYESATAAKKAEYHMDRGQIDGSTISVTLDTPPSPPPRPPPRRASPPPRQTSGRNTSRRSASPPPRRRGSPVPRPRSSRRRSPSRSVSRSRSPPPRRAASGSGSGARRESAPSAGAGGNKRAASPVRGARGGTSGAKAGTTGTRAGRPRARTPSSRSPTSLVFDFPSFALPTAPTASPPLLLLPPSLAKMNGQSAADGYQAPAQDTKAEAGKTTAEAKTATESGSRIGWAFLAQYYSHLNKDPSQLHCFYTKRSTLIHSTEGEEVTPCYGQQEIHAKIMSLGFEDCKVYISNVDSQSSAEGGIIVQVIGEMSNRGANWRKFAQTFFLAQQPNGYFVLNDICRYIKEEGDESLVAETPATDSLLDSGAEGIETRDTTVYSETASVAPSGSQVPVPAASVVSVDPYIAEPAPEVPSFQPVQDPISLPNGTHHHDAPATPLTPIDTPTAEVLSFDQSFPTVVAPSTPSAIPLPTPAASVPTPIETTVLPTPPAVAVATADAEVEVAPASPTAPTAVAPSVPSVSAAATLPPTPIAATPLPPAPALSSAPTPVIAAPPPTPAAPKTWASLAAMNRPSAPQSGSRTVSAAVASTSNAGEARAPRPGPSASSSSAPRSTQEGASTACFVKGVIETISEKKLRDVLSARFGPVKEVSIIRPKACAFLEFEHIDSARRAIQACLRPLEGGEGGIVIRNEAGGEDIVQIVPRRPLPGAAERTGDPRTRAPPASGVQVAGAQNGSGGPGGVGGGEERVHGGGGGGNKAGFNPVQGRGGGVPPAAKTNAPRVPSGSSAEEGGHRGGKGGGKAGRGGGGAGRSAGAVGGDKKGSI